MYEDNDKEIELENQKNNVDDESTKRLIFKPDWVSLAIKLGLLLLFSFLIIFIFTRFTKKDKDEVLADNVQIMRSAAYNYFKNEENRPVEKSEEVVLSLQDMLDYDLIDNVEDISDDKCDPVQSYVGLTKMDTTKYDLDVYVNCDEKSQTANYTLRYNETEEKKEEPKEEKKEATEDTPKTTTPKKEDTVPSYVLMYEQKKTTVTDAVYSCPDNYRLDGKYCYSEATTETVSATPKYKEIEAKETKASVTDDEIKYQYADVIITTGKTTLKCPTGYTLVANKCQKIINALKKVTPIYSCNDGTLSGTKCKKVVDGTTVKVTYECKNGKLVDKNKCYLTTTPQVRCKYGQYDKEKKQCYTIVSAVKKYTTWKFQGTTTLKADDTSTLKKYVKYKTSTNKYAYRVYTRKAYYSCLIGKYYKDGKCKDYDELYKETYCPDGYEFNKDKSKCYKYVKATEKKETVIKCPSGYQKVDGKCVKYVNATKKTKTTYSCSTGYTKYGTDKCIKQITPTTVKGKTTYSCPDGYTLSGTGSNSKCYKKIVVKGTYYCKDKEAVLKGDMCYIEGSKQLDGYTCPDGYELSGTSCYKYNKSQKINATLVKDKSRSTEVMWSETKHLDGWTWTGKTKKV